MINSKLTTFKKVYQYFMFSQTKLMVNFAICFTFEGSYVIIILKKKRRKHFLCRSCVAIFDGENYE